MSEKIKNSLRNGPDELGYYGEGESARGGFCSWGNPNADTSRSTKCI